METKNMGRRILSLALAGALAGAAIQAAESPKVDACHLLEPAEIAAVQGAAVTHSKGTQRASGGFLFAQCYYVVAAQDGSVSLEVTLSDPSHSRPASPAQHWQQSFHRDDKDAKKDAERPQPVAGLGDEAFWLGDRVMGALYVLKGDRFFRVSVGGSEDSAVKIEKGRELAVKALRRL
jgi:hypothetical protein